MVDSIISLLVLVTSISVLVVNVVRNIRKTRFAYRVNIILHGILSLLWASRIIFHEEIVFVVVAIAMSVLCALMAAYLIFMQRCAKKQEELLKMELELLEEMMKEVS